MVLSYIAKEKFFDRVQHDKLMSLVAKSIDDKPTLKLIRRFLQSGIMRMDWSCQIEKASTEQHYP
jgi:retron-type reverse transcriptase